MNGAMYLCNLSLQKARIESLYGRMILLPQLPVEFFDTFPTLADPLFQVNDLFEQLHLHYQALSCLGAGILVDLLDALMHPCERSSVATVHNW